MKRLNYVKYRFDMSLDLDGFNLNESCLDRFYKFMSENIKNDVRYHVMFKFINSEDFVYIGEEIFSIVMHKGINRADFVDGLLNNIPEVSEDNINIGKAADFGDALLDKIFEIAGEASIDIGEGVSIIDVFFISDDSFNQEFWSDYISKLDL